MHARRAAPAVSVCADAAAEIYGMDGHFHPALFRLRKLSLLYRFAHPHLLDVEAESAAAFGRRGATVDDERRAALVFAFDVRGDVRGVSHPGLRRKLFAAPARMADGCAPGAGRVNERDGAAVSVADRTGVPAAGDRR